jgi:hypothetical protein
MSRSTLRRTPASSGSRCSCGSLGGGFRAAPAALLGGARRSGAAWGSAGGGEAANAPSGAWTRLRQVAHRPRGRQVAQWSGIASSGATRVGGAVGRIVAVRVKWRNLGRVVAAPSGGAVRMRQVAQLAWTCQNARMQFDRVKWRKLGLNVAPGRPRTRQVAQRCGGAPSGASACR